MVERGRERGHDVVGLGGDARREWVVETWHEDALVPTGVGGLPWMIPQ